MSVAKIKSTLPKGELNGLDAIAAELAADFARGGRRARYLILAVTPASVLLERAGDAPEADPVTGEAIPPGVTATARIHRIEAVAPGDEDIARRLLVRGMESRSGRVQLDYDTETALLRLAADGDGDSISGD